MIDNFDALNSEYEKEFYRMIGEFSKMTKEKFLHLYKFKGVAPAMAKDDILAVLNFSTYSDFLNHVYLHWENGTKLSAVKLFRVLTPGMKEAKDFLESLAELRGSKESLFVKDLMASTDISEYDANQLYYLLKKVNVNEAMKFVVECNFSEETVPFDGNPTNGEMFASLVYFFKKS